MATEPQLVQALQRYAAAERSDPFAFARGMAHLRQGLCGPCEKSEMKWDGARWRGKSSWSNIGSDAGSDGHYDATHNGAFGWNQVKRM